jgi:hypothetical protein
MVEQVLDGHGVAARQRNDGKNIADARAKAEPLFRSELVDDQRGHRLGDRADLEQRAGADRQMRFGIGKAEIEDGRKAVRRRESEGQPRKREEAAVRLCVRPDRGDCTGEFRPPLGEGRRAPLAAERDAQRTARECAPAKGQALQLLPL